MPVKTAPTLVHPTLGSTITGVLGEGDVMSYLGVPYASLSKRWAFAIRRDDIEPQFVATVHG